MRVFISYSHDSEEHQGRVWDLCAALRKDKIDCTIDQYLFSPAVGWPRWAKSQLRESQFVLVVATEKYEQRYEGKEEPGKGLGAAWEGFVITQELYESEGKNEKFIPVVFSREDARHIPVELRGATWYYLPGSYDKLLRHLRNKPARPKPPLGPPTPCMQKIENQAAIQLGALSAGERRLPGSLTESHSKTGCLMVNIFDSSRQPLRAGTQILLRLADGNQSQILNLFYTAPNIPVDGLPIYNNIGDNYTLLISAKGYRSVGLSPVKMFAGGVQSIDLMLLPNDATFNFRDALWDKLKVTHPNLAAILAQGADGNAARDRYSQLLETQPASLASFFNLATAMGAIKLPVGTPLDYIKGVIWDDPANAFAQDRFFGWADPQIIQQIITATVQGEFTPEFDPSFFHGTATRSWKQTQFGEANVQFTFHEHDPRNRIGEIDCVKIELDMDYYKDLRGHFLLGVVVNAVSQTLTDPKQVYVLRWMAGRHAGVPDFNPPYVIA